MSGESALATLSWETASVAELALCNAAELAGSVLAHEGPFAPTVAYDGADGRRFLLFDDDDCDEAVARGRAWLAANPHGADRAVLVCDGYTERAGKLCDAFIAEIVDYVGQQSFIISVPYRPLGAEAGFAVFGARFLLANEDLDQAPLKAAFGRGIATHPDAAAAWIDHFDNSAD
jgi:hypothetical protein